ncbi:hypothetical protein GQ53DRAFT_817923 [Thozetella sp. PMI_491]|nr:hypothetical protein GQ53DRAFT_817923 [Thozetella sp. PMI_491]
MGGNGGLGQEIIKYIVCLGTSIVILACRSRSQGDKAKKDIETVTSCSTYVIEVRELDIVSPLSIRSFVAKVNALPRLDALISNAGIQNAKCELTYGTEQTLAVNVFSAMLLSIQLVLKPKETAQKYHVVAHMTLYNLSKLLLLYTIIKLSGRVEPPTASNPSPVVINFLDPCFCKAGLPGEIRGWLNVAFKIFEAIAARPAEEGARLVVLAASASREAHGLYSSAGVVQEYFPVAKDEKKVTHVWGLLIRKLEGIEPGIMQNL